MFNSSIEVLFFFEKKCILCNLSTLLQVTQVYLHSHFQPYHGHLRVRHFVHGLLAVPVTCLNKQIGFFLKLSTA